MSGYALKFLPRDLIAGLTLAAIAIPEQMATARLGGFSPAVGFFAFASGSIAFAVFGANRLLSVGADSTITPIFASSLVLLAATGSPQYAAAAAVLALMVGAILMCGGLLRLGWIADLLSVPITTGFLAGISIHIVVSQLPEFLGVTPVSGSLVDCVVLIAGVLDRVNPISVALGTMVFVLIVGAERISARIPGALIGLVVATACVPLFGLEARGVAVLGAVSVDLPHISLATIGFEELRRLVPLALIIALVIMVQTAATTRSFPSDPGRPPSVNCDFVGVGAGSLLAGLVGAFPVNASPPRTAIVSETGGQSQIAGLAAAVIMLALLVLGARLLSQIPQTALAGVLMFVAMRIFRASVMLEVYRRTFAEFALIVSTIIAIVVLPTVTGVGLGVALSLLHGMWSNTRARVVEFEKVPGTSIWWTTDSGTERQSLPGVSVVAFQAPLSFLNAYEFRQGVLDVVDRRAPPLRLVVLEASSIIEIDFTAAEILKDVMSHCRSLGIDFAVARLESARAFEAMSRFGILDLLGPGHLFLSVDEATRALDASKQSGTLAG